MLILSEEQLISDFDCGNADLNDFFNREAPELSTNTMFLNKAKLTVYGKITNAAMILLGKDEFEHYINPSVAKIWLLRTVTNQDKDFEIFGMPLLLTIDEVLLKICNLKYRYLRVGTLFPDEALPKEISEFNTIYTFTFYHL